MATNRSLTKRILHNEISKFSIKASFVFLLVIGAIWIGLSIMHELDRDSYDRRTYSVDGTATKEIRPDSAEILLGKLERGDNPIEVQRSATESLKALNEKLAELGIEEESIVTANFNIVPYYENIESQTGRGEIAGYELDIQTRVTIEGIDTEDELIQEVIAAGLNSGIDELRNMQFYRSDIREIRDGLEAEALAAAKKRAERVKEETSLKLGDIIDVNYGRYFPNRSSYFMDSVNYNMGSEVSSAPREIAPEEIAPVSTGSVDIEVTVTITYELR